MDPSSTSLSKHRRAEAARMTDLARRPSVFRDRPGDCRRLWAGPSPIAFGFQRLSTWRMKNKWLRIADWLDTIAVLKIKDWECEFPPNAVFPPDELDESVSAWCRIMAKDMTVAIYPPEEVQPWILARLVSCASKAKTEAERGDSQPDMPDRAALEAMLVDQWHGELRQKWIMAIKDGKP